MDETMHRSWKYKVEVGSTILSYFNATRVIIPLCLKKKNETSSHGWCIELLNHCITHCTPETNVTMYIHYPGNKILKKGTPEQKQN